MCVCVRFPGVVFVVQVVSRGNDQVAITSRFESRADAGEPPTSML